MYNLRNDKKNTRPVDNNKPKTKSNKNLMNMQTPINKQLDEVRQQSEAGSSRLSIVDSPFKILNCMDKRFEKFAEQIQRTIDAKFQEFKVDLLNDLREKYKFIEEKLLTLNERVITLEKNNGDMQEEINILKTKLKVHENHHVSSELRISGIPYAEKEDLTQIFKNVCRAINNQMPNIRSIYRVGNYNSKQKTYSKDGVIIVKLWSAYDKNSFLKSLAGYKRLNKGFFFSLRHLDFNSDEKFFLNENLTQHNFRILRAALSLKRKKVLCSAFTVRGYVYIKRQLSDDPIKIDDIEMLNQFFPSIAEK